MRSVSAVAPIVTCDKSEMYARIGESVKIMCEVRANPGSTIEWHYGENKDPVLIESYQQDSNLRSSEEVSQREALRVVSVSCLFVERV